MMFEATVDRTVDSAAWPSVATASARACVVCAAPLPTRHATPGTPVDPYPVCQAAGCKMVVGKRVTMPELEFKRYLALQARLGREVKTNVRLVQERTAAEALENTATWDSIAALAPPGAAERFLPLLLPSGPRRRTRLADSRRAVYRQHIQDIIAEAVATPSPTPGATTKEATEGSGNALAGHLCAMCGGGCCVRGYCPSA